MKIAESLKSRTPRIKRGTYALSIKFSPVTAQGFSMTAYWGGKNPGQFKREYTLDSLFTGDKPKTTPCRLADAFIRDVLTVRGIT